MEDQESFVPCYPPPVDITELTQSTRFNNIAAADLADWYGVLVAYTNMTLGLLEDEEMPYTTTEKLRIILKMLTTVLSHFSGVVRYLNHACMHTQLYTSATYYVCIANATIHTLF